MNTYFLNRSLRKYISELKRNDKKYHNELMKNKQNKKLINKKKAHKKRNG